MAHMCGCMFLFAIGTNWEIQKTQSNHPQKGLVDHLAYTTWFVYGDKTLCKKIRNGINTGSLHGSIFVQAFRDSFKKNLQITTTHYPLLEVYVEVFRGKSYESHHFYPKKRLEGAIKGA